MKISIYLFLSCSMLLVSACGGGGDSNSTQGNGSDQANTEQPNNTNQTGDDNQSEVEFDFGPDTGALAPEYSNGFRLDSISANGNTVPYSYNTEQNSIQFALGTTVFGDYTLDQYNRVSVAVRFDFNRTNRVFYNGAGLITRVERFDTTGSISADDTPNFTQTFHYNEDRQLIRIDNATGSVPRTIVTLSHTDGRLARADSSGRNLDFVLDIIGRVTNSSTYNGSDQLERVFDNSGNLESFSVKSISGDLIQQETYEYSPAGSDSQNLMTMKLVINPFSDIPLF